MAAAASKYTATSPPSPRKDDGKIPGNSTPTTLNPYATPVPRPISVNIFKLRVTRDRQPRTKNGHPPHRTTGVASINSSHCQALGEANCISAESPGKISAMATIRIGIVSATQTQNLSSHASKLGIFLLACAYRSRLQCHTANWAGPRFVPYDLRMHGAGVFSLRYRERGNDWFQSHSALRTVARPLLAHLRIHRACVFVRSGFARGERRRRNLDYLLRGAVGRSRHNLHRMRGRGTIPTSDPRRQVFCRVGAEFLFAARATKVVRLPRMNHAWLSPAQGPPSFHKQGPFPECQLVCFQLPWSLYSANLKSALCDQ